MSALTWDFQTWQDRDLGVGSARGTVGGTWKVESQALPFSNAISGVVSFLIRSDYTANESDLTGGYMTLHGISFQSAGTNKEAFRVLVYNNTSGSGTLSHVMFTMYDTAAATNRYFVSLGDEDGINGLQTDKWYQVAFSADTSGFLYAINGSTTPTVTGNLIGTANNPGSLNINAGTERWWWSAGAASGFATPTSVGTGASSLVRGPAAFEGSSLDLSDAAVRARIFDADGNLKHPGENGSKWFNDAYTTTAGFKPDVYCVDGIPRLETGSAGLTFVPDNGGGGGWADAPGGLRKFYE